MSALLPGSVLAIELVALVSPGLFRSVGLADLNNASTAALGAIAVAVAVIIGYTNRSLTFRLLGVIFYSRWDGLRGERAVGYLRHLFSDDAIRRALAGSPVVDSWQPEPTLQNGYWLYCKYWLRIYAPALAVDDIESDINLSYDLVVPVLLGAPAIIRASTALSDAGPAPWWAYGLATAVSLVPAGALAKKGELKQRDETLAGLERYLIARLMAKDQPAAQLGGTAPEDA